MKFLYIGSVWPEPFSSAAGVRTLSILRALKALAPNEIVFSSPAVENPENRARQKLEDDGIRTVHFQANDSAFDSFCETLAPDLVIFDRFIMEEQFGWRVRTAAPRALRVIDTQDLHFVRKGRKIEDGKVSEKFAKKQELESASRELASFLRSDLTLVISRAEMERLRAMELPESKFFYFPLLVEMPKNTGQRLPAFGERDGFLCFGNFRHEPNAEGWRWFLDQVWPRVRDKLPNAKVQIRGAYPIKDLMSRSQPKNGIEVGGAVENLDLLFSKTRVNLAPLLSGAGLKGKILEGWARGVPVVSTSIGIEGFLPKGAKVFGALVRDAAEGFAQACVELHENETLWNECSIAGLIEAENEFGWDPHGPLLIEELEQRLRLRRTLQDPVDWLGEMLWQQAHRSTEYFSRWIEAKNQKGDGSEGRNPASS